MAGLLLPKQRARFKVLVAPSRRPGSPFDPLVTHFTSIGPLRLTIIKGSRRHGGSPVPFTWPAGVEMAEVTLRAGSINDMRLFNWAAECAAASAGIGPQARDYQRDVTVLDRGRDATVVHRWHLLNAWVTDLVQGDYDNDSDEFLIQSVTLQYDGLVAAPLEQGGDVVDTRFLVGRV